jgi:hypothetical protein
MRASRFGSVPPVLLIALIAAVPACVGKPDLPGVFLFAAKAGPAGGAGIYAATANGKEIRLVIPDPEARAPRLSPDGRTVYYSTLATGGTEIAAYALATKSVRIVTDQQIAIAARLKVEQEQRYRERGEDFADFGWTRPGEPETLGYDVSYPSPSPDGALLGYVVVPKRRDSFQHPLFAGDLYVAPVAGGWNVPLGGNVTVPTWLPRSTTVIAGGGIYIYRRDLGASPNQATALAEADRIHRDQSAQGEIQSVTVSHDGKWIAWVQGQSVVRMPTSGGDAQVLASAKFFKFPGAGILPAFVAWSPDDQYLAVCAGLERGFADGGIFIFRADGKPAYKKYQSFQVEGLPCRVDAFDWVRKVGP